MAMIAYAVHLQEGKEVQHTYKKAAKYFKKGADLSHKKKYVFKIIQ